MPRGWPAIVTAALALTAGCGDGEEAAAPTTTVTTTSAATPESATTAQTQDGAGEEEGAAEPRPLAIDDVLEAVLTGSADPALVCDELVTEDYVRTAYGAREGCIAAQKPGALADSLEGIDVNSSAGERATGTVVPAGGPYDGVDVEVELVRDGEGWRVDSLLADVPAGP